MVSSARLKAFNRCGWNKIMAIYRIAGDNAQPVEKTTFQAEGILERRDLQKIFRHSVGILVPNAMVLAEEFGDWEESRRRLDL